MSKSDSSWITTTILDLPWARILGAAWKHFRKLLRGFSQEGINQVLEYHSTLELLDVSGRKAHFSKQKKVRYLQDRRCPCYNDENATIESPKALITNDW